MVHQVNNQKQQVMPHYFFIDNKTKKVKTVFGTNFINPKLLAEFEQKSVDEILKKIESEFQVTLVELSHQIPHNDIEFMFVLPSRTDVMLSQTNGNLPSGRWVPKISEILSDHVDGEFRHIDVYFDDDANSFGVTVAKVNEKTGFVDWCCPEYKNHPQVFEHITNL